MSAVVDMAGRPHQLTDESIYAFVVRRGEANTFEIANRFCLSERKVPQMMAPYVASGLLEKRLCYGENGSWGGRVNVWSVSESHRGAAASLVEKGQL